MNPCHACGAPLAPGSYSCARCGAAAAPSAQGYGGAVLGGPAPIAVDDVLRTTFAIWKQNAPTLLALAAAFTLPGQLFSGAGAVYQTVKMREAVAAGGSGAMMQAAFSGMGFIFFGVLVSFLLAPLGAGAGLHVSLETVAGRRGPSFGEAVSAAMSRYGSILGALFLVGLAVGVGTIFCLVPGILAAVIFSVAVPVVVAEGKGSVDALSRSNALTEGARLEIFVAFLAAVGIVIAVMLPVGCIIGIASASQQASGGSVFGTLLQQVISAGVGVVFGSMSHPFATVLYARRSGYGATHGGAAVADTFR